MSEFPTQVDCVIIGTGLTNSIIAAACSRVGKSVLHLDTEPYYGSEWASFTFDQLIEWIKTHDPNNSALNKIPEELKIHSRSFCLDLCPNLIFTNGKMVDLLIKSDVARYHEFTNSVRILALGSDYRLQSVPFRRRDIFISPLLENLFDKRRLTKLIEACLSYDEDDPSKVSNDIKPFLDKPFIEYLEQSKLNETLSQLLVNSVAMIKPEEATKVACCNIKRFIAATEKYGKSPFFFPLYGSGEFPQSFCRLCAVHGGVYCLNKKIDAIETKENKEYEIILNNGDDHKVACKFIISSMNQANVSPNEQVYISRGIVITKFSVLPNDSAASFLKLDDVFILEVCSSISVAPSGYYITYGWTKAGIAELKQAMQRYFGEKYEDTLWNCFYLQNGSSFSHQLISKNMFVTNPPGCSLDYDDPVTEAETIFKTIFSDEEFFPSTST